MFNLVEPLSGHFIEMEWREWDEQTKSYRPPISFRIKGAGEIGVSTGIKEIIQVQENNKFVNKTTFRVQSVSTLPFKNKDKVRDVLLDKSYVILKVSPDVNHFSAMNQLMFRNANVPVTLYLGN
jgi:hypothetical protein